MKSIASLAYEIILFITSDLRFIQFKSLVDGLSLLHYVDDKFFFFLKISRLDFRRYKE
jgi:hypothetical protein